MEQLKTKDMMGYTAASATVRKDWGEAKHKPSENDSYLRGLIGAKGANFNNLPPSQKIVTRDQKLADFKLKQDIHVNDDKYEGKGEDKDLKMEKAKERAYSIVGQFVPGYDNAGKTRHKIGAFFGHKGSKDAIDRAKRHVLVNHGVMQAGNVVKAVHPDVDPNLVDMGAGVVSAGVNHATDYGIGKYKNYKKQNEQKKKQLGQ